MSDYIEPVILPPDDDSVSYPIPAPDYVEPDGGSQEQPAEEQPEQPAPEEPAPKAREE